MKRKNYFTPSIDLCSLSDGDVVTMSVTGDKFEEDIFG